MNNPTQDINANMSILPQLGSMPGPVWLISVSQQDLSEDFTEELLTAFFASFKGKKQWLLNHYLQQKGFRCWVIVNKIVH